MEPMRAPLPLLALNSIRNGRQYKMSNATPRNSNNHRPKNKRKCSRRALLASVDVLKNRQIQINPHQIHRNLSNFREMPPIMMCDSKNWRSDMTQFAQPWIASPVSPINPSRHANSSTTMLIKPRQVCHNNRLITPHEYTHSIYRIIVLYYYHIHNRPYHFLLKSALKNVEDPFDFLLLFLL